MSALRLVGISKRYDGGGRSPALAPPALDRIDLSIDRGELVVIVGASGCGKSTVLRLIAGLEAPTAGRIYLGDDDVTTLALAQRDVAMVFQSYTLNPHTTVFENIAFALRVRRLPETEIRERVEAAATALGIEALLDRRPGQLSAGQRQRVAIGRAVVREPAVFLFDEPLANLDVELRATMRRELVRVHEASGATSIYVTHDRVEAMTLADRIVVLRDGVVEQVGTPVQILERPASGYVAELFRPPGGPSESIQGGDSRAGLLASSVCPPS